MSIGFSSMFESSDTSGRHKWTSLISVAWIFPSRVTKWVGACRARIFATIQRYKSLFSMLIQSWSSFTLSWVVSAFIIEHRDDRMTSSVFESVISISLRVAKSMPAFLERVKEGVVSGRPHLSSHGILKTSFCLCSWP